jgi:hypothetical protein
MAGGANYVLDKGYFALSTYNGSAAGGVTKYRAVKLGVTSSKTTFDLNVAVSTLAIGVVQEDVDQLKVATGKAVADVRLLGITKMYANGTPGAIGIGSLITCGAAGGAVLAASGNKVIGICVGMTVPGGTVAAGDLIDVLLTPGMVAP